ncbi:TPA: hypothetical protein ACF3JK_003012 [Klebsiella aerogenes]|uniref:hypothetical protein n=1 Tax=Klebsiella aerogenes TaxID=548 RepID=UPI000F7EEB06|nr:hypothetical protein [Klebsiella aerogenes]RSW87269.1 hypothetical protein EGH62_04275 [Klebsiella aerogenes]HDU4042600.1 hypothetical protein [Klebsiella aerogenes]HDU4052787.1 hypothetical protein [Klebsiella aerogenes]HEO1571931.1 hypothetical protein [Klebsiella aerogenes]
MFKKKLVMCFMASIFFSNMSYAAEKDDLTPAQMEKIAKMTANPIGAAWMLWTQYDNTQLRGDKFNGTVSRTTFQPVMSFPLKFGQSDWNFVVRPVLQYYNTPNMGHVSPNGDGSVFAHGRISGMGDTGLLTLLGPNREDGFIWGVGATQLFDTADNEFQGQGHYQAGPALLVAKLAPHPGGTNIGMLAQHWWSTDHKRDRKDTSHTDIQYFINYRLSGTELIGMSPDITIDWKKKRGDRLTFPVGLGYSNVVKLGKLPVRFAAELQYSVISPDDVGARWNMKFMFIPVIPSPFL